MEGQRFQSQLGDVKVKSRKDYNMGGMLMEGIVIKVHHKWHTADVMIVDTGDIIAGSEETEGKYSCRIMERSGGFDETMGVSFGDNTPIQEGSRVVIGFLRNNKAQPIIFGCLPPLQEEQNISPTEYPVKGENKTYEQISVSRNQDYEYKNGSGEFEKVSHNKNFFVGKNVELSDERDGFDFKDLHMTDKMTGETPSSPKNKFAPMSFLAVVRDAFDDATSKLFKFFVSSTNAALRITRDVKDNKLTFMEMSQNGVRFKQQLDSYKHDEGSNFSEIRVSTDGNIIIQRIAGGSSTGIVIADGNIQISTTGSCNISSHGNVEVASGGTVNLKSKCINLKAPSIHASTKIHH